MRRADWLKRARKCRFRFLYEGRTRNPGCSLKIPQQPTRCFMKHCPRIEDWEAEQPEPTPPEQGYEGQGD